MVTVFLSFFFNFIQSVTIFDMSQDVHDCIISIQRMRTSASPKGVHCIYRMSNVTFLLVQDHINEEHINETQCPGASSLRRTLMCKFPSNITVGCSSYCCLMS